MNRLSRGTRRVWERSMALASFAFVTLPTVAWSQDSSGTSSSHSSHSTTTTYTPSAFFYDWRLWAAFGAVLLVIVIIALSRGRGGDRTTIIK